MTEKRFLSDKIEDNAILSVKINDILKDVDYFIMTKEFYEDDIDNIVDLLNDFSEENEQLKQLLKEAEEEIRTLKESIKQLLESIVEKDSEN